MGLTSSLEGASCVIIGHLCTCTPEPGCVYPQTHKALESSLLIEVWLTATGIYGSCCSQNLQWIQEVKKAVLLLFELEHRQFCHHGRWSYSSQWSTMTSTYCSSLFPLQCTNNTLLIVALLCKKSIHCIFFFFAICYIY